MNKYQDRSQSQHPLISMSEWPVKENRKHNIQHSFLSHKAHIILIRNIKILLSVRNLSRKSVSRFTPCKIIINLGNTTFMGKIQDINMLWSKWASSERQNDTVYDGNLADHGLKRGLHIQKWIHQLIQSLGPHLDIPHFANVLPPKRWLHLSSQLHLLRLMINLGFMQIKDTIRNSKFTLRIYKLPVACIPNALRQIRRSYPAPCCTN